MGIWKPEHGSGVQFTPGLGGKAIQVIKRIIINNAQIIDIQIAEQFTA